VRTRRLRACRVASTVLVAAGRTDPARLDAGDFTRVLDAICQLRRADGGTHSASHRNLLVYLFCEVIVEGGLRRVDLAGAAQLELVAGVAQLRPQDTMVEAMLRG
jgi:hypothetical protein